MLVKDVESSSVRDSHESTASSFHASSKDLCATKLSWLTRLVIRRCVGSAPIECGCQVGFYETFGRNTLSILDVACAQHTASAGGLLPADWAFRIAIHPAAE
jgi:hypothetical protein